MKQFTILATLSVILTITGCQSSRSLNTVSNVNLNRYQGKWFEIASLPQSFQKNCDCTTATYTRLDDGTVEVFNECNDRKKEKVRTIKGKAVPVEAGDNSRLKVRFFGVLKGDYQIIALSPDYNYALVGTPNRKSLWVLAREPKLKENTFSSLKKEAERQGFDVSQLRMTKQDCAI